MDINGLPQPPRLPMAPISGVAGEGRLPSASAEVQQNETRQAAESFASYLYAQVFSQMRPEDSGEEGGLFSGEQSGMFMDFFDQALGKHYATNGGNALVEQLVAQMTRQQGQSARE
ncbi:Rod binding protein [compost metagenome]